VEALWLLAKINVAFQIAEKVAYGVIGLFGVITVVKYRKDYKESIENEEFFSNKLL
jgi:uncharacterized membrane protein YuzA (DUF378 family)